MGAVGWTMTMPMMMRFHRPSVRWRLTAPLAEGADTEFFLLCCVMTGFLDSIALQSQDGDVRCKLEIRRVRGWGKTRLMSRTPSTRRYASTGLKTRPHMAAPDES